MSFGHIHYACKRPGLTVAQRMVLVLACLQVDDETNCVWPSQKRIAETLGYSKEWVSKIFSELQRGGHLTSHMGKIAKMSKVRPYYKLHFSEFCSKCDGGELNSSSTGELNSSSSPTREEKREKNNPLRDYRCLTQTPSFRIAANEILDLYPNKGKLSREERSICRRLIGLLVSRDGLKMEDIKRMTEAFRFFVEDFGVERRFRWNPTNFFKDPDRVSSPIYWGGLCQASEDDIERWMRDQGIKPIELTEQEGDTKDADNT